MTAEPWFPHEVAFDEDQERLLEEGRALEHVVEQIVGMPVPQFTDESAGVAIADPLWLLICSFCVDRT